MRASWDTHPDLTPEFLLETVAGGNLAIHFFMATNTMQNESTGYVETCYMNAKFL